MLPPRSSKRRATVPRWLLVPLAITALALLTDAAVHARSPKVVASLSNYAWVDKVLPDITASTAQGRAIGQLTTGPLPAGAQGALSELDSTAASAASTYRAVASGDPPGQVQAAAGLLEACLAARKQGAAEMALAVQRLLKGGSLANALGQMSAAVSEFEVSDSAYQLFLQQMGHMARSLPPSRWVSTGAYQTSDLLAFAERLQRAFPKAPASGLVIDAVSTAPPPLSMQGNIEVLSPASSFSVTVVVANTGQSALQGVKVTAIASPAVGTATQQLSATVDLPPGQAIAVTLPGLRTPASTPATLTVEATMPGASAPAVSKQLQVELPGPNFAPSTSTSTSGTTTTGARRTTASAGATTTTAASGAGATTSSSPTTTTSTVPTTTTAPGGTSTTPGGTTSTTTTLPASTSTT